MVRATAPDAPTSDGPVSLGLSEQDVAGSSMAVYRRIGRMLGMVNADAVTPADPVRTRFVVDIVSGTSAGGINAIFLAKALANGQDLEGIKRLWKEQADLEWALPSDIRAITLGLAVPGSPGPDGRPGPTQIGLTPEALVALLAPCTEADRGRCVHRRPCRR